MSAAEIDAFLIDAERYLAPAGRPAAFPPLLAGRTVALLFFEPSTRTRCSFELAAKRLGATVVNLDTAASSAVKGESLPDTLYTLEAMHVDLFVVRHTQAGVCADLARLAEPHVAIVNAGEGRRDHPTQGLLDALTIKRHKPNLARLSVAIVGDIAHSRVACSTVTALRTLGVADIRLIGPAEWLPEGEPFAGTRSCTELADGIADADVVMALRIQKERMAAADLPDFKSYFARYGLTEERLSAAAPDAIVMHPGPMNRGVEISAEVADGPQSVIREQVTNGVAVRMAVMQRLLVAQRAQTVRV
jgi:aspartate carbamoyltransferase catalytic subunit